MISAAQDATVNRRLSSRPWLGVLILCASVALISFDWPGQAGPPTPLPPVFFSVTGHTVREPYLKYFLDTGGVVQYGYPRTDEYVDPVTRRLVQYFDDARLEWEPGNPAPYQVELGLLGVELGRQQAPLPLSRIPPAGDPNCQYYAETGHSLCYVFRNYWLQNGGLDRFGYPIGEYSIVGGLIVQDFQRARLEWHPTGAGPRIQLAPLGLLYYQSAGFDPRRLQPVDATAYPGPVLTMRARASVFTPVIVAQASQVAFVFVTDQFDRPLSGVAVTLVVNDPDGVRDFALPPTNAGGTSFQVYNVGQIAAGTIVPLDFILTYPAEADSLTRTSYVVER